MHYHTWVNTLPATHDPTLLVHGGAWAIPPDAAAAHEAGVRRALEVGHEILARGGAAIDAVEAAVAILEDDPTFDAGRGSFLTADGRVQLDALLMVGGRMKAGGVACVEHLRNPIHAARLVLEKSPHVYFVGEGAEQFAHAHGMPLIDNSELVLDRERERLIQAQARHSAGLADQTFSGLQDDKDPETAFRLDSETLGAPGLASETWETTKPDPAHLPLKGTGFSPYIEPAKEKGALAPEGDLTVLGADTTVTIDNQILGKPENETDAARMLRLLSGRTHRVITGVAVVTASRTEVAAEVTGVTFLTLSNQEIESYIATGEPMDKAGAYAIQGRAARWIPRITGDYSNVVGLPIALVTTLLESR